jgi:hypothetical protein
MRPIMWSIYVMRVMMHRIIEWFRDNADRDNADEELQPKEPIIAPVIDLGQWKERPLRSRRVSPAPTRLAQRNQPDLPRPSA